MNYTSINVRDAMRQISGGEIYLPAIQRKFVWGPRKIETLFDSILRGYPIGTFLFWFVEGATKDEYTFYQFIQDFHEKDNALNRVAPAPHLAERFTGVLDGQQRLNSMYVALQGSYAYRQKYARRDNPASYPKRQLYINLFFEPDEDSHVKYRFAFLPREEAVAVDSAHCWFLVKDVLGWQDTGVVFGLINDLATQHPEHAATLSRLGGPLLSLLWQRLCADDVVTYFSVKDQELDRIVDIFIRVNSTGVPLSRTDLLFSSIVAHWDEGRAEIEDAIQALNEKGGGFSFNNDFVMRCCLALTDGPIRLKVNAFRKQTIDTIRDQWAQIRSAMETAVDLLVEWGFSRDTLPTQNAVVPVAYFAFKGGDMEASNQALRQYLVRAILKQVFRSGTDSVLSAIRNALCIKDGSEYGLRSRSPTVEDIVAIDLPGDRTLRMTEEDIEDLLDQKKGAYTFAVLSLLYPHLKFGQVQFHQDHIHPYSGFTTAKLRSLGLDEETVGRWQDDRDRLPNLQLMKGTENKSKNATPFDQWLNSLGEAAGPFALTHRIPAEVDRQLVGFETFFAARKELLRRDIQQVLAS